MTFKKNIVLAVALLLIGCSHKNEIIQHNPSSDNHNNIESPNDDTALIVSPIPMNTPTLLSTFTTQILTTDPDRYHNITLVRDRLNGYILPNGAEFSYNDVCGPFGPDDGFEEASILLSNGEHDEGYGGGVCQLSSTLYNAIKDLPIEITERHHHSAPVRICPGKSRCHH